VDADPNLEKKNLESRAKKGALHKVPHLKSFPDGRGEMLLPAEEIFRGDELCDAGGFGCESVDFLIADHG
jgi:hypothetical protein